MTQREQETPAVGSQVDRGVRPSPAALRSKAAWLDRCGYEDSAQDMRQAADEIERAWAARDAAVSDLEAHAQAEVRLAVAAERERWRKGAEALADHWDADNPLHGTVSHWLRRLAADYGKA